MLINAYGVLTLSLELADPGLDGPAGVAAVGNGAEQTVVFFPVGEVAVVLR